MENGVRYDGGSNLTQQLSDLSIGDSVNGYSSNANNINGVNKNDGLFQVMKAVEAAEATIKQQMEENHRLRSELQKKIQELENYKLSDIKAENSHPVDHWNDHGYLPPTKSQTVGGVKMGNDSAFYDSSKLLLNKDFLETQKINETVTMARSDNTTNNGGILSYASTSAFPPSRYQPEQEYNLQFNAAGHGLVPISEAFTNTRDQEQEILLLRKHVAEYSIKEAQINSEKTALEKRIAYMRLAFDQQQKDLVDAESKALSYRQDIIEENIRLTYALQDAQEERSTFVSSLMPLLAEYSLQPPVADAQSIVSNVKVLFRHLQEKLIGIEKKLKESQYQLAAWCSDVNPSSYAQSPLHSFGNKNGHELVPQQAHSEGKVPISSDRLTSKGWDVAAHSGGVAENLGPDLERHSPLMNRNHSLETNVHDTRNQGNSYLTSKNEEITNKQVTFSYPASSNDVDNIDVEGNHNEGNEREPFANWNSNNSPYATTFEDPNSYSPYLTPVLEEPGSSFSEAADDDPLPTVESLQISGDAFPGRELQASGYSRNGTTSCNFEWVRHMEDGSVNFIDGAKQPTYLVTADDVDTYLAIEVQPMDNRKRKGKLVKVFANEHRKIVCDPDMHDLISKAIQTGSAEHRLSLWNDHIGIWEAVTLVIKKDGINIKDNGFPVNYKFSPTTTVIIPYGNPMEFFYDLGSIMIRLQVEQKSASIRW
ncbi:hypothetical protein E3N88_43442 [Mikania micrantha]|uniref:Uncharacterized protein n=1 Tax=Mikania micrantha TaxID=192012 RepID=A0A5N6LEX0_9ASTR|nr:hypothetical protein E3N88_43442 [Mikania micrantha]